MKDLQLLLRRLLQRAPRLLKIQHPIRTRRVYRLGSLGISYIDRYRRTGAEEDLELAIHATPNDHPDHAARLASLGISSIDRYRRTGAEAGRSVAVTPGVTLIPPLASQQRNRL